MLFQELTRVPDIIILTLLTLLISAATLYLPNHISLIYNRIWYYVHGESTGSSGGMDMLTSKAAVTEALRTVKKSLSSDVEIAAQTASHMLRMGKEEL